MLPALRSQSGRTGLAATIGEANRLRPESTSIGS
jgi:hypothetical protein